MMGREFHDTKLLAACCRAYNDWSAEFCSKTQRALRWAAILPMQDLDEAMKEAHRAAKNGAVSFLRSPQSRSRPHHLPRDYMPLWAEVEKLGLPISTHDSASASVPSFGDRMDTHVSGHILSHPFEAMAAMAGLIWYGVIREISEAESRTGRGRRRMGSVLAAKDGAALGLQRQLGARVFDQASDGVFQKSNFFVAFRGDEPTMKAAIDIVGDNNFLWDTDYPHPDGTFPWGIDALLKQSIPYSSKKKILWDNATRAFGFN